jgi:hypothetical protein
MAKDTELLSIFSQTIKEINDAGQSDILKGSISSIKALQSVIKEQDKLIDKTLRAGDEKAAMRILKSAKQAQEAQVEATNNLREAKEKLLKLEQEGNTKARDAQLKVVSKINQEINRLAREAKLMQKNAAEFGKGAEYSLNQYSRLLETREERIKELGKAGALIEEKFANRFEASVNAFTSGVGDLESFGDTFAGSLKSLGSYLQQRAGKAAEKAQAGQGSLGMANMLGTFSKIAATAAVVAGSVMVLVKLFQFIEGSVLEANKKLLAQASIADLSAVAFGSTADNLKAMRKEFQKADFANEMNITLDEALELTGAFNQLNLGVKQFGGGLTGIRAMKDAMKEAKGQSYALGISMDEASQYMAKFSFDLGVAASDSNFLSTMADEFASIRDMAIQSGYSTANFFKKVEELAGSLENMNYRSREAGILFLRFSKVLGKSGLDKALQSLFSGFRGEDYLEQLKRNMISKSGELRKATEVEAVRFANNFQRMFGGDQAQAALREAGLDLEGLNSQQIVAKIGALNEAQRQEIMGVLVDDKRVSGEMRDQLYSFMRLARGANAKASTAEKMAAQEEFSAGGNLRANFARMSAFLGDKNINDLSQVGRASLLSLPGVTKEMVQQFAQLQTSFKGQYQRIKGIASGDIAVPGSATKVDERTGEERPMTKAEYIASLNAGVSLDENGQLVMTDTRMAIGTFTDFLQAKQSESADPDAQAEREKTTNEYLAEGREATQSVFDVLNNNIQALLRDISGGIMEMVTWLTGGSESDETKRAKQQVLDQYQGMMEELLASDRDDAERLRKRKRELAVVEARTDLSAEEKASQRATLTADIAAIEARKTQRSGQRETIRQRQSFVRRNKFSATSADALNREATRQGVEQGIEEFMPANVRAVMDAEAKFFNERVADGRTVGALTGQTTFEGLKAWLNSTRPDVISASGISEVMSRYGMTAIKVHSKGDRTGASVYTSVRSQLIGSQQTENRQYVTDAERRGGARGQQGVASFDAAPIQASMGTVDAVYLEMNGLDLGRAGGDTQVMANEGIQKGRRGKGYQGMTRAKASGGSQNVSATAALQTQAQDQGNESLEAIRSAVETSAAERRRLAEEDQKARSKEAIDQQKQAYLQALDQQSEDQLLAVATALGAQGTSPEQIMRALDSATEGQMAKLRGLSATNAVARNLLGGGETPYVETPYVETPDPETDAEMAAGLNDPELGGHVGMDGQPIEKLEDFWVDRNGKIWKINPQDMPSPLGPGGSMAMTKPGGAVQNYVTEVMNSILGNGGVGGGFSITVNVNGAQNPTETGRQVVQEIRRAQESLTGRTR